MIKFGTSSFKRLNILRKAPEAAKEQNISASLKSDQTHKTIATHYSSSHGLTSDEIEFLPPILELLERPFSPTLKWVMRILSSMIVIAVIAAYFVKTEIYVRSFGEIGPVSGAIPIAVPVSGAVSRIYVEEFDQISQGSTLFELEQSNQQANIQEIRFQKDRLSLIDARLKAALYHLESGEIPPSGIYTYLDEEIKQHHIAEANASIFTNDIAAFEYSIRALKSQRTAAQTRLEKINMRNAELEKTYNLYRNQFIRLEELEAQNYVSSAELEEAMLPLLETSERIHQLKSQAVDFQYNIDAIELNLREIVNNRRLELVEELEQVGSELQQLKTREDALNVRLAERFITAPFPAIVSRIGENIKSGVVRAGEPAIWLFDKTESLVMHAEIANADISQVEQGKKVRIKIDSLDYSDFGSLEGTVASISQVTKQNDLGELVYPIIIELSQSWMEHNGVQHDLIAGMQGSAGIVTGERTILAWFLAPFEKAFSNAFH